MAVFLVNNRLLAVFVEIQKNVFLYDLLTGKLTILSRSFQTLWSKERPSTLTVGKDTVDELQLAGYDRMTVNHKYNFVDPFTGVHTQNIELLWGAEKW